MFLTVQGEPIAKGRPRFARGHTYTPKRTIDAENIIKLAAFEAGVEKMEGPLRLRVTFSMRIPKSWPAQSRKEALEGFIRPTKTPDMDNLIKLVADALNGIAYEDDKQIVEIMAVKKYGEPKTIINIEGIE
mgnify:CR=1 FL=1|tara:strand:+ start:2090 stop:2482 length:393 start_codon:yes stop_codon:yes gene_type:complete